MPPVEQMAWVVPDLDAACRAWHRALGIGPFLVTRRVAVEGERHRGVARDTIFATAVAQSGSVQIELVQQIDDGPSVYRDMVPAGSTGFHHVAFVTADFDAAVAAQRAIGHPVAYEGRVGDMRFAYVDARGTLGHMVEIVEEREGIRRFFNAVRRAAETWDGDPAGLIREVG